MAWDWKGWYHNTFPRSQYPSLSSELTGRNQSRLKSAGTDVLPGCLMVFDRNACRDPVGIVILCVREETFPGGRLKEVWLKLCCWDPSILTMLVEFVVVYHLHGQNWSVYGLGKWFANSSTGQCRIQTWRWCLGRRRREGLQGGRGGGGGAAVFKKLFSALWASIWSKNKGGRAPPLDPPLLVNFTLESCLPFV